MAILGKNTSKDLKLFSCGQVALLMVGRGPINLREFPQTGNPQGLPITLLSNYPHYLS